MPARDRLLACLVAVVWGVNFPAIHLSLEQFPPFTLVALRFALLAVPTLLFVPRPEVPLRWLLGYGVGFGVLQFFFLYLAMRNGMPSGLASLVLQSSAPFTVLLAGLLLHERLTARRLGGVAVALTGLGGIAVHRADLGGTALLLPVLLTICGGFGWALGNLCSRQARAPRPLQFTLWMSVVPPVPMAVVALVAEGPVQIGRSFTTLGTSTGLLAMLGLAYTVLIGTVVGSGIWTTLLARHPSSAVAPFSMLVPVAGIAASWLVLGDTTSVVELSWGALVLVGVLLATTAVGARRASTVRGSGPEGRREPAARTLAEVTAPE